MPHCGNWGNCAVIPIKIAKIRLPGNRHPDTERKVTSLKEAAADVQVAKSIQVHPANVSRMCVGAGVDMPKVAGETGLESRPSDAFLKNMTAGEASVCSDSRGITEGSRRRSYPTTSENSPRDGKHNLLLGTCAHELNRDFEGVFCTQTMLFMRLEGSVTLCL